ncbi:signal peptidase II [Amphritea balenae]|uniref:Lipoprotein signal peptidase n=1 Tax=Amphritea balenae TaxID=452629 RepID=A0A3P1SKR9_9GAMM|nr:signal peptidase II [Amphritea balenae]RRC97335.1 lipoprotein signal peptidase [Amphritea balenae]GGK83549.1 lipoprotein signal peptidase [Amphritea balenae]
MAKQRNALIWLWLVVLIVVADLLTKYLANAQLPYGVAHPQLAIFDLTLLYNKGAAFSFLSDAGGWQRWFFATIAIVMSGVLVVWLARTPRQQRWLGCGLASVLGGALGNLYDRIVHGYVIDFISLHYDQYYFPAFNLADIAITIGAGMLIIDMIWFSEPDKNSTKGAA